MRKYKPDVVVGCWVTQLYQPGDEGPPKKIGSSVYGIDEFDLLDHCQTYLFAGNRLVHGDKRILKREHEEHELPAQNVVYVWNTPKA